MWGGKALSQGLTAKQRAADRLLGQRCRGKKSGVEPNRYGDPKSCDGLTGKQGSANEGRGPGTASFAAGLGESEVGAANSARHAIASGRTA